MDDVISTFLKRMWIRSMTRDLLGRMVKKDNYRVSTGEEVFGSVDLLEKILGNLTLPEVAGAQHVNKMCNMVGKDVKTRKHAENDRKIAYWVKEARQIAQPFFYHRPGVTSDQYLVAQEYIYFCLNEIYNVDWSYFVHTETDGWFEVLTRLDTHYLFDTHDQLPHRTRITRKITPLMYIDNTHKYTVYWLKQFAIWKGVPKAYKMKRSQLVKSLTRPPNDVYFFQDHL